MYKLSNYKINNLPQGDLLSLNLGLACSKSNCRNEFSYIMKRDPAITISRPCGLMKTLGKYTVRPCGCSLISCNQYELTEKTIRKQFCRTGCSELIVVQITKKLNSKFCETALSAFKFCSYSYTIPTDKETDKRKNYWINQTFNKDSFDETELCHPLQRPCSRLKHRFTIMIISISILITFGSTPIFMETSPILLRFDHNIHQYSKISIYHVHTRFTVHGFFPPN